MNDSTKSGRSGLKRGRRWPLYALVPVLLVASFGLGMRQDDDLFELRKNFEIFGALYEQIILGYVDDVRAQPFMRAGVEAMLEDLDPYTHYYDEAEMTRLRILQENRQGDPGLSLGVRGGRVVVLAPESETAPYEQGIRTGDAILQVDDTPVEGYTVEEVFMLLAGEPGSTVNIVVQHPDEEFTRTFTLPRLRAERANVSWAGFVADDTARGIGYVKLNQFGDRSARETRRALRTMHRTGSLNGIILDLRGNPGGILGEAVELVDMFLPNGTTVVSTRARADGMSQEYRTERDPLLPDTPVVVLMDRYSASASEIVAGALQDYDRAVILGETSFGKGLVQIVRPLPHNTSLKMTVSRYFTPAGRSIQSAELISDAARVSSPSVRAFTTEGGRPVRSGVGIEPDVRTAGAQPGELQSALARQGMFFLFADGYAASVCAAEDGSLGDCLDDDALMSAFRGFTVREGFAWRLPVEQSVSELRSDLGSQAIGDVSAPLETIDARIDAYKQSLFETERAALLRALKS
ncbi:MAG: S41 family peptidase, partial [Rhodothermales bacterium]|nr:S41 family peptidase [Rhodothermales bacterium]